MSNHKKRYNFLVFIVDQMQSYALGCNGNPDVRTPHIDALASQGANFPRAYCNNPVCMPSRSTLLTGLTPRQHGCLTNGTILPETAPTVTQTLANHGYRTHAVGKLHLQPWGLLGEKSARAFTWEDRERWLSGEIASLPDMYYGFQSAEMAGGHGSIVFGDYTNWLNINHPGTLEKYSPSRAYYRNPSAPGCWRMNVPAELHYNNWIADRSMAFLDQLEADQPFFLWCSFPDPHAPFAAARPYSEMYNPDHLSINPTWDRTADELEHLIAKRAQNDNQAGWGETELREITAQTYGMISHIDDNIGKVMQKLEQRGLDENTIVVFMADHGEYLGSHHLLRKGVWPYEELLRVPFIWKAPAASAISCNNVVSLLDFVPTVLDYAGIDPAEMDMRGQRGADRLIPGRSLKDFVSNGKPLESKPSIVEYDEDWYPGLPYRVRGIIEERYKLVLFPVVGGGMLFDLQSDPDETVNLYENPEYDKIKFNLAEKLLFELTRTDRLDQPRICGA